MNSRIFQFSETPVSKEDYITSDQFIDNFVGEVADSVSDDTNREEDIQWLLSSLREYGEVLYDEKEGCIIFPKGFKNNYFKDRFQKLKEVVVNMTLEQFASDTLMIGDLQNIIEDKLGFYIYYEYFYEPIDSFIRELEENKKYYIGGTVHYHF